MSEINFIKNSELLTQHFGYWPKFHDDTILSFEIDTIPPSIKIQIESYAKKVDSDGSEFSIINLVLRGVTKLNIDSYAENIASIIFELNFKQTDNGIEVVMDASTGLSFQVVCKEVVVDKVESSKISLTDTLKSKNW
jgi:hypothetical protein